jgi:thioredoxin reductase (NADPH)
MNELVDVTVIGGGPVGLFASFYAGMRGMSVRIVDSLSALGGQLTALYPEKFVYDMPGFPQILAKDLAAQMIEQGLKFSPEVCLDTVAAELVKCDEGYVIRDPSGKEFPTRTVIIAAGNGSFTPTKLGIDREEEFFEKGHLCYGVQNREQFRGKRIAIFGGGDSALDWALDLSQIAASTTLVHRRDQFRAHDETVAQVRKTDTVMKLFYVLKSLEGTDKLERITLHNTAQDEFETLPMDAVIVNIGFKSSLGTLKDWGMQIEKNQIVVNELFETALPNVFAVGDVCAFPNKIKLIATGVGEAAIAVCHAKTRLDPAAKLFPGHSSDMEMPAKA